MAGGKIERPGQLAGAFLFLKAIIMAKRKTTRRSTKKPPTPKFDKQEGPTFSMDAVVLMGAMGYNIREAIQDLAIEKANGKNPVPVSSVVSAIKSLRLTKYMEDILEEDDVEAE